MVSFFKINLPLTFRTNPANDLTCPPHIILYLKLDRVGAAGAAEGLAEAEALAPFQSGDAIRISVDAASRSAQFYRRAAGEPESAFVAVGARVNGLPDVSALRVVACFGAAEQRVAIAAARRSTRTYISAPVLTQLWQIEAW